MTVVNISLTVPGTGGRVPARGTLLWTPTARVVDSTLSQVVMPAPFAVTLDGTQSTVAITVDPTTSAWAWSVREAISGAAVATLYFNVPTTGPVAYSALTQVDPTTLTAVTADPAWVAMANATVTSATVNGSGNLILTRTNTTTVNAGSVTVPIIAAPPTGIAATDTAAIQNALNAVPTTGGR